MDKLNQSSCTGIFKRAWASIGYVHRMARQSRKQRPAFAMIAVTRHCKRLCKHCYEYNNSMPIMSDEIHRGVINKLCEIGVVSVFYYGGEPASHPSIVSFIKYAKECQMHVTMCSDISSSSKDHLLEILQAGTDVVSFSVDSVEEGGRDIGVIKENLKFFQDLRMQGLNFGLNCAITVHKGNLQEVRDIVMLVESYGKISFSIQPAQYPVPYHQTIKKSKLILTLSDVLEVRRLMKWLEKSRGFFVTPRDYLQNFHKFLEGRHRWDCGAQRDMLFIDCDGSLRVCSYFIEQDPPLPLIPLKMTYRDLTPNHWENVKSLMECNWKHCNTQCYTQAYYCSRYYGKHYLAALWYLLKSRV